MSTGVILKNSQAKNITKQKKFFSSLTGERVSNKE